MYRKSLHYSMYLLPIVVLCIGLLLSLTGIFSYPEYESAEDITATVSDCDSNRSQTIPHTKRSQAISRTKRTTYTMYVDYTYNGTTYSHVHWDTSYNPVDIGTQVTIKVSPNNPAEPITTPPMTFLYIGVPFVLVGLILAFRLIPAVRSGKEFFINVTVFPNSKTTYVYIVLPIVIALAFLYGGIKSNPLFLIGTFIGIFLSVLAWELLLRNQE